MVSKRDAAPWEAGVLRGREITSSSEGVRSKNREGTQAVNNPYTVLTLLKRSRVVLDALETGSKFAGRSSAAGCHTGTFPSQHYWLHWAVSLPALLVFPLLPCCKGNALKSSVCIYTLSF